MRNWILAAAVSVCLIAAGAVSAQTPEKLDLNKQPTLYVVGYAHLDTEWRWEYPQVISEYIRKTMEDNFKLFDKYPHYVFNFSGANRYRFMKEYFPADYARLKKYIDAGRWFPAGSSMEEGDVNAPSAESIIRQVLYGNNWFRKEFGKASAEYMIPDCFGFPASLPTILAHAGVKGFSTQKLVWGSSADGGGLESLEHTPEGTPFNVGVWVGPDGESVLAGLNPGDYSGGIYTDLSKPLPALPPDTRSAEIGKRLQVFEQKFEQAQRSGQPFDPKEFQEAMGLDSERSALRKVREERQQDRYQGDWAARVLDNGKLTGVFTDYHYYGTGDIGGTPDEESVKRLEAIITKGNAGLPPDGLSFLDGQPHAAWPEVRVGEGPVRVLSSDADQMFLDITAEQAARLPRYTGEMELTNHSAGSLTSQAYQKRWLRQEEVLADAAEKASIAAEWLGARAYPLARLNDAWTLVMGGQFHDIAAGTATPKSYEFAWNDDVIAMNQFAGVLQNATEGVGAALDTAMHGVPVVVYNSLNIAREDVVEASVNFTGGAPSAVHVTGPDGREVPAQVSGGKVLFVARVPSVGYAVYDVEPGAGGGTSVPLRVSQRSLENESYRVTLNADGDVASIFDKSLGKELLAAPARLAISYDNPRQWPAWNMDWDQEQAAPKEYVSGPAKVRIVENGPVRVAVEVSRETAGSAFVQTIRLSAGDAGRRVEFANAIDWNTKRSNLKAAFPLTAANQVATYNWDIGTIERKSAEPKKFEVPSHQWIDLTDMSGSYGATILTDSKNGSDKPNDNTIRLTLIRTPGVRGGYADQATQDIGHHEFLYGIAGHAGGWRAAGTDWQGQRLNTPLMAFSTAKHGGALGRQFSLLQVSGPRIRVLALKKAELSDEVIVRLVELDGRPQPDVRISFAAPIASAREVNGQEQPVGEARLQDGALVTSFMAYQPRTFAVRLAAPAHSVTAVASAAVTLPNNLAVATNDGDKSTAGFDGKGDALPAEMLPSEVAFDDVTFRMAPAKTGSANAVVAKGQRIDLPAGSYNRLYLLAAAANGDRKVSFQVGDRAVEVNVQDWGGFIGQWDDRKWIAKETNIPARGGQPARTERDDYAEMVGVEPGYIKRADVAWWATHHHNAAGENVPYSYSYLFAYRLDLPAGIKTVRLPDDANIRVLAMSLAREDPWMQPAQPLYDVLPAKPAGAQDFGLSSPSGSLSLTPGHSASAVINVMPKGGFAGTVQLSASGLPAGVTASFSPAATGDTSRVTVTAAPSAANGTATFTVTGVSGGLAHDVQVALNVEPLRAGAVPVDLTAAYNVTGIHTDDATFAGSASLDGGGWAFSAQTLGSAQEWDRVPFRLGPADSPDVVTDATVTLPAGKFGSLRVLATGVEGSQESQVFTVTYSDGSSNTFTQSLSDWFLPQSYGGESVAVDLPYRLAADGARDGRTFHIYGYSFPLDGSRAVRSITLPGNRQVVVLAMTLVP